MLINGADLIDIPVLSLQTGQELARSTQAIVNPHNLSLVAFEVAGQRLDHHPSYLRTQDIRELSPIGMIVDSSEEFIEDSDIITMKDIYELRYELKNKPVLDEKRQKIGKVMDYNVESGGFVIQQLTVKKPLLKSFNDGELIIHRSQIVEITDHAIIIKSKAESPKAKALPKTSQSYVNPFRQSPQVEVIETRTE